MKGNSGAQPWQHYDGKGKAVRTIRKKRLIYPSGSLSENSVVPVFGFTWGSSSRLPVIGAHQGGMLVGTPLVETEQDRSIQVEDLTEVVMGGSRLRQAK